ncbi:MAG TPA: hypothetical protein VKD72_07480 [Gemmataceae bacterium]|nr:hypothetical protein [Gemmataceae bacterium]
MEIEASAEQATREGEEDLWDKYDHHVQSHDGDISVCASIRIEEIGDRTEPIQRSVSVVILDRQEGSVGKQQRPADSLEADEKRMALTLPEEIEEASYQDEEEKADHRYHADHVIVTESIEIAIVPIQLNDT